MQGNKTWCRFFCEHDVLFVYVYADDRYGTRSDDWSQPKVVVVRRRSWLDWCQSVSVCTGRRRICWMYSWGSSSCISSVISSLSSSIILSLHVCHGHERKCNRVDCQTTCLWAQAVLYIRLYFCTAYILLFARLRRVASVLLDWLK